MAVGKDSHGLFSGTPGRIRTCDLQLRRLALYPAQLRARINFRAASPYRGVHQHSTAQNQPVHVDDRSFLPASPLIFLPLPAIRLYPRQCKNAAGGDGRGILEKTRALLVAKLGPRIKDASAADRALRDLILELEKARSDILRGLDSLKREAQWLQSRPQSDDGEARLDRIRADIKEGDGELARVVKGIAQAKAALAEARRKPGSGDR